MSRDAFITFVRREWYGHGIEQSVVDGFTRLLDKTEGLGIKHRAYVLATAFHETQHTMQAGIADDLAMAEMATVSKKDRRPKGKRLGDHVHYKDMRKAVTDSDKPHRVPIDELVARYAHRFEAALKAMAAA